MLLIREKKMAEKVNGGENATYLKKHRPVQKGHPHPWKDGTQPS